MARIIVLGGGQQHLEQVALQAVIQSVLDTGVAEVREDLPIPRFVVQEVVVIHRGKAVRVVDAQPGQLGAHVLHHRIDQIRFRYRRGHFFNLNGK